MVHIVPRALPALPRQVHFLQRLRAAPERPTAVRQPPPAGGLHGHFQGILPLPLLWRIHRSPSPQECPATSQALLKSKGLIDRFRITKVPPRIRRSRLTLFPLSY